MDLGWILHGFVQIWAWIWEITYQLTLLEWRLAWYWAIYLPWAGFPNQFVRNSISKRGKFIDLRSKLRSFSAFSRSFNRSKIGFMFTPVFCNASRNTCFSSAPLFGRSRLLANCCKYIFRSRLLPLGCQCAKLLHRKRFLGNRSPSWSNLQHHRSSDKNTLH